MLYESLIPKFYPQDDELRKILWVHSRQVADRVLRIVAQNPQLGADAKFVEEAAMLHDIGIFLTHAPRIHCHGAEPYLLHGRLGAELLRAEGYPQLARVCERHTGTGLTRATIAERQLPLPDEDFCPETIEEIIICYADKFFSKTHLGEERSLENATKSLERFGEAGVQKFLGWAKMFGELE